MTAGAGIEKEDVEKNVLDSVSLQRVTVDGHDTVKFEQRKDVRTMVALLPHDKRRGRAGEG